MKAISVLIAATLLSGMCVSLPVSAEPHIIVLATPADAYAMCKAEKMEKWTIAAIIGPPGYSQYGPGYDCMQGIEPVSNIGDAVEAGKGVCELATAEEAKPVCSKMSKWDIAIIQSRPGYSQFGPGYECVQQIPLGRGITSAICK